MSGAADETAPISAAELARLVKLLGMMGSKFDNEALSAARKAVEWVAEAGTSWAALLEPPPVSDVVSVSVGRADPAAAAQTAAVTAAVAQAVAIAQASARQAALDAYQRGLKDGRQQGAVQASMAQTPYPGPSQAWVNMNAQTPGPRGGLGGAAAQAGANTGLGAQAAQASASGQQAGSGQAGFSPTGQLASWQDVARAILGHYPDRLRGSQELDFVQSLLARNWHSLTTKQDAWLRDIAARAGLTWP